MNTIRRCCEKGLMKARRNKATPGPPWSFHLWPWLFVFYLVVACGLLFPDGPVPTSSPERSPSADLVPFELVFASDRGGTGGLYRLTSEGEAGPLVVGTRSVWDPAFSPDGYRLVYTDYTAGNGDIVVVNADGTGRQVITNHPADDYWPAWSPDGGALVFVSERDGSQDLYLVRLDECRRPDWPCPTRRLAASSDLWRHRYPAWAPDGSIVFSGLDAVGLEAIYRLRPEKGAVELLGGALMKGTMPAVAPDGTVAFITWDDAGNRFLALWSPTTGGPHLRFRTSRWIGHPAWTPDGRAVLFTMWNGVSHDIYLLNRWNGQPVQLTASLAWDDTPTARPSRRGRLPQERGEALSPTGPRARVWWGANLARFDQSYLAHDLGLTWVKGFVDWARAEPEPGRYEWRDVDNTVREAERAGLKLLLRVHNAPAWARPPNSPPNTPPDDPQALGEFMRALAARYQGRVHAYEIWNEPNLAFEWGGKWPEPARYAEMVRVASAAVRATDEKALVVAGALAVTGEGSEAAIGDLDYLRAFYAAGARGTFDALSVHPYGFGRPPDMSPEEGLGLRRAEEHRQVMVQAGDADTPIWFTELGWALEAPGWDLGEHEYGALPAEVQARYWAEAVEVIEAWPWVQAAFIFNLDFSTAPWYPAGEQMRWYALLNPDGSPRPAYTALRRRLQGMGVQPFSLLHVHPRSSTSIGSWSTRAAWATSASASVAAAYSSGLRSNGSIQCKRRATRFKKRANSRSGSNRRTC